MGDVRENMKPTTEKTKGVFGRLLKGRAAKESRVESDESVAESFVDHICIAEEKLSKMIESKEKDVINEKGSETSNKKKLKVLETIDSHLQMIVTLAEEYSEIS